MKPNLTLFSFTTMEAERPQAIKVAQETAFAEPSPSQRNAHTKKSTTDWQKATQHNVNQNTRANGHDPLATVFIPNANGSKTICSNLVSSGPPPCKSAVGAKPTSPPTSCQQADWSAMSPDITWQSSTVSSTTPTTAPVKANDACTGTG